MNVFPRGAILTGLLLLSACGEQKPETTPAVRPVAPAPQNVTTRDIYNGFDVSDALVPKDKIESGGPPKDGIPAIDEPKFVPLAAAEFMQPDDLVMSVTFAGETRSYSHRILNLHEIVNDQIGTNALVVTYCPLCGSGMVFDRRFGDELLDFGVSGLLYQSDVLMYDRQSESLWSQLKMQAVSGQRKGEKLRQLPAEQMTFAAWSAKYPDGKVLSTETRHRRTYDRNPYVRYERSSNTMFDVGDIRKDLPNKAWVIGLRAGDQAVAVPVARLKDEEPLRLELGDQELTITFDRQSRAAVVKDGANAAYPFTMAYWFAWQAFHRDTAILPTE